MTNTTPDRRHHANILIGLGPSGSAILSHLQKNLQLLHNDTLANQTILLGIDFDHRSAELTWSASSPGQLFGLSHCTFGVNVRDKANDAMLRQRPPWMDASLLEKVLYGENEQDHLIARLAFIINAKSLLDRIKAILAIIDRSTPLQAYIFGSLSDRCTGGIFLDVAYLLEYIHKTSGRGRIEQTGIFLLPSSREAPNQEWAYAQAYEALQELNHYYQATGSTYILSYSPREICQSDTPPFNRCYLLESPHAATHKAKDELLITVSRWLLLQLCVEELHNVRLATSTKPAFSSFRVTELPPPAVGTWSAVEFNQQAVDVFATQTRAYISLSPEHPEGEENSTAVVYRPGHIAGPTSLNEIVRKNIIWYRLASWPEAPAAYLISEVNGFTVSNLEAWHGYWTANAKLSAQNKFLHRLDASQWASLSPPCDENLSHRDPWSIAFLKEFRVGSRPVILRISACPASELPVDRLFVLPDYPVEQNSAKEILPFSCDNLGFPADCIRTALKDALNPSSRNTQEKTDKQERTDKLKTLAIPLPPARLPLYRKLQIIQEELEKPRIQNSRSPELVICYLPNLEMVIEDELEYHLEERSDVQIMRSVQNRENILSDYPFPIAYTCRALFYDAYWKETADLETSAQRLFEETAQFLGSIIIAEYRAHGSNNEKLNQDLKELFNKPITIGKWAQVTRSMAKYLIDTSREKLFMQELFNHWDSIADTIDPAVEARNKIIHQLKTTKNVLQFIASLDTLLERLSFLCEYTLLAIRSSERRWENHLHHCWDMTGSDPRFTRLDLKIEGPELLTNIAGLLNREMNQILYLHPFYMVRNCSECNNRPALYRLNGKFNDIKYIDFRGHKRYKPSDEEKTILRNTLRGLESQNSSVSLHAEPIEVNQDI